MVGTFSLRALVNTARRPSSQRTSPSTASASLMRSSGSQLVPEGMPASRWPTISRSPLSSTMMAEVEERAPSKPCT